MSQLVYFGDEATAAGYRLAGVRVYTPGERGLLESLRAARADASLIMLSTALAECLPAVELERLLAGTRPPLLLVPPLPLPFPGDLPADTFPVIFLSVPAWNHCIG